MHSKSHKLTVPLRREHMPADYSISLAQYTARGTPREQRIPADFGPRQSLHGFEAVYHNIIDYIVRITHRIWEQRDIDYIEATYAHDSHVFDDYGLQPGAKKIIADTRHTTGAFSDIRLIADEIVWAGDDKVGFHTSHRAIVRGVNDGDSKYGPASHRQVDIPVIANCVSLHNRIYLEHVLYNTSAMIRQLGLDLNQLAVRLARAAPAGWPRGETVWNRLREAGRPDRPISVTQPVAGFDVDAFVRDNLERLWNRRDYDALAECYLDDFPFEGPTDRKSTGPAGYRGLLESLHEAFSDLQLRVDEVYWMGNDAEGYLTSERWSATATHSGSGIYGPATGRPVTIWGITQHEIKERKIAREWMLFNELDLMMQIAAARDGGGHD